mmetsp:Transcript_47799/g.79303  ORF Transcript_47799/g.79303 Transcript_47799/m.79303 type:complete len:191 (-) Transcript_47799:32-604(-)
MQSDKDKADDDQKQEEKEDEFNIADAHEWLLYREMFINAGFSSKDVPKKFEHCQERHDFAMWKSVLILVQKKTGNDPTDIEDAAGLKNLCETDEQKKFVDRGGRGVVQEVNADTYIVFRTMLIGKGMGLEYDKIPKKLDDCNDTMKEIMKAIQNPQKIRKLSQLKDALQKSTAPDKIAVYWKYIEGLQKS